MAADGSRLQGEICENPISEEKNIPQLLEGLLNALVIEQRRLRGEIRATEPTLALPLEQKTLEQKIG